MTTQQFFSTVSNGIKGSHFEIVVSILIILLIFFYFFYKNFLSQWLIKRKRTREFYDFLKARHNIYDWEWKAIINGIKKSNIKPFYLPLISSAKFEEVRELIAYELNDDGVLDDIEYKLFNR